MTLAAGLFILTYIGMIIFSEHRPYISSVSALLFIILGILPVNSILKSIDFNVIFMIWGTMGLVELFTISKMPHKIADIMINSMPNLCWIIISLSVFSGFVSAFIDNVATVLMLAPIAIAMSEKLNISPVKPIIAISISSNLQGAATLVGDTTSILLGSYMHLNFFDFFVYKGKLGLFFIVQLAALFATFILYLNFKKLKNKINKQAVAQVSDIIPSVLLLIMVFLLIGASFIPEYKKPATTNGLICLSLFFTGFVYDIFVYRNNKKFKYIIKNIDYKTLLLLISLFIIIGGITEAGLIEQISLLFTKLGSNKFLIYTVVVWSSALISAFIDNIPYVATMLPVMQKLSNMTSINSTVLFFGLLIGATLGGNLTPIGASANIASLGILRENGHKVKNKEFMKISVPFTLSAVLAGYLSVWFIFKNV